MGRGGPNWHLCAANRPQCNRGTLQHQLQPLLPSPFPIKHPHPHTGAQVTDKLVCGHHTQAAGQRH